MQTEKKGHILTLKVSTGFFGVHKDLGVCCLHEGKTGGDECVSIDWKCPLPCHNQELDHGI